MYVRNDTEGPGMSWQSSFGTDDPSGRANLPSNMLIAHARNPYVGSRKVVVTMGQMIGERENST